MATGRRRGSGARRAAQTRVRSHVCAAARKLPSAQHARTYVGVGRCAILAVRSTVLTVRGLVGRLRLRGVDGRGGRAPGGLHSPASGPKRAHHRGRRSTLNMRARTSALAAARSSPCASRYSPSVASSDSSGCEVWMAEGPRAPRRCRGPRQVPHAQRAQHRGSRSALNMRTRTLASAAARSSLCAPRCSPSVASSDGCGCEAWTAEGVGRPAGCRGPRQVPPACNSEGTAPCTRHARTYVDVVCAIVHGARER